MRRNFTFLCMLICSMLMSVSAWADVAVLSSPTSSVVSWTDPDGIITITDASDNTGIQAGSGSLTYNETAYTPMKLSSKRQFNLSYKEGVTINSVKLICTDNKNDGTEYTIGVSSEDRTSIGTFAPKGSTPSEFDITEVTGLNATVQFLAIIVVDYTPAAVTTPTLTASTESLNLALASYEPSKSGKVTLKGAMLADGEYNVTTSATGLSISPSSFTVTEGAVNQEFTVTYTSSDAVSEAKETISFSAKDNSDNNISASTEVTFSKVAQRGITEAASISDSYKWDFTKTGATAIQLTDNTSPSKTDEFIVANIAEVNNNADFNSEALKAQCEYIVRDGKYFQGGNLKFNTTVPGKVKVVFSNTGNRTSEADSRFVYINGVNTEVGSWKSTANDATAVAEVEAGDVEITAFISGKEDPQYVRIYSVEFEKSETVVPGDDDDDEVAERTATWDFTTMAQNAVNIQSATGTVDSDIEGVALTVDATNGKLASRGGDAQFNSGTIISVPVRHAGDIVTVVSYPGYHYYTVAGNAADADTYAYTATASDATAAKVDIVATGSAYLYSISVKQIAYTQGGDVEEPDYDIKEKVVYQTKFQDWEKAGASTEPTEVAVKTTDDQDLTFTLFNTAVDPEGTNTKFTSECVTTGYLQTAKDATNVAYVSTSTLASITKLEIVQAATGGSRGITVSVKGDGDADWVELHNKAISVQSGEALSFDVNRENCQIKIGTFAPSQNAYVTSMKIYGNVKVAKRTFTDFKIDFRTDPYTVVAPEAGLPAGVTVDAGTYHDKQHGYTGAVVTVPVDGPVKFTIGACGYTGKTATVSIDGGEAIAIDNKTPGCDNGFGTYTKYATYTYNVEKAATLTFNLGVYCPYIFAQACEFVPSVTVSYFNTDGKLIGEDIIDGGSALAYKYGADDVTVAEGHAFRGWFDGKSTTALKVAEGKALTEDTNLYAHTSPIESAETGTHYMYDLTKAYFYPEDHENLDVVGGKYYNNHGFTFGNGDSMTLKVSPKAQVMVGLCTYTNTSDQIVVNNAGETVATLSVIKDGNEGATPDGKIYSFYYENANGEADELTFQFTTSSYIHSLEVYNVEGQIEKDAETGYYTLNSGDAASLMLVLKSAQDGDKIFLPAGTYNLGNAVGTTISANNLSIVGESLENTIICTTPEAEGLGTADLILNTGTNNYFQDIQFRNDYPYGGSTGRAASFHDKGSKTIMKDCWLNSHQDTYYSHQVGGVYYFEGGKLSGCVDYLCGNGKVFYEGVTLVNDNRKTYITANSELYVFNNCTVDNGGSEYYWGRAWSDNPKCVFLNTTLKDNGEKLGASRWVLTGINCDYSVAGEYGTMDADGNNITPESNNITFLKANTTLETILSAEQAEQYTIASTLGEWAEVAQNDAKQVTEGEIYLVNGAITTTQPTSGTYRVANARGGFGPEISVADAITAVYTTSENGTCYNLQGQRVNANSKGIVILNGKKMIVNK